MNEREGIYEKATENEAPGTLNVDIFWEPFWAFLWFNIYEKAKSILKVSMYVDTCS